MKYVLLFLLSFIGFQSFAQKWCPAGAEWSYRYETQFGESGYDRYVYEKDTIYKQQACKKLNFTRVTYNLNTKHTSKHKLDPYFLYSQNDTVFIYFDGIFRPTYFFNAKVGDTLSFGNIDCNDPDLVQVVDSTGKIVINNDSLRFYRVKFLNFDNLPNTYLGPDPIIVIERMGSMITNMHPYFSCFVDNGWHFVCSYKDNEFGSYFTSADTCWLYVDPLSQKDIYDQSLKISPNPVLNSLNISSSANEVIRSINIIDMCGIIRIKQEVKSTDNLSNIDIQSLESGLYILQIITSDNNRYHKKFIKVNYN